MFDVVPFQEWCDKGVLKRGTVIGLDNERASMSADDVVEYKLCNCFRTDAWNGAGFRPLGKIVYSDYSVPVAVVSAR